jgi:hypothetical protein
MWNRRSSIRRGALVGSAPILACPSDPGLARVGLAAAVALSLALILPWAAGASEDTPRTLVIAFDCLPYETVARLAGPQAGERRLLAGLRGPVPLISSFPSTTSVSFGGILGPLGLDRSPGYEARFFDWRRRRVVGGMLLSYFRIPFAWREFFDWNRKSPARRMLAALRPARATRSWFERAVTAFQASDKPLFFVYNGATDTLAHLRGPQAFEGVLADLDRLLREARRRRPFRVVLLSDHGLAGGEPLRNVFAPVKRALREAGWRYRRRLRGPRDVALTPFGLVSSFELYTAEGMEAEVAREVAAVPGVDLCALRQRGGWTVVDGAGAARFTRRRGPAGAEWRYRPIDGDPLEYSDLAGEEWRGDRWWLESTAGHRYPDALHRLARSFELVDNPASILCSTGSGHMFGARKTERSARLTGGRLRWTHGALERDATRGFLMSDDPRLPLTGPVRFDEALAPLAAPSPPT